MYERHRETASEHTPKLPDQRKSGICFPPSGKQTEGADAIPGAVVCRASEGSAPAKALNARTTRTSGGKYEPKIALKQKKKFAKSIRLF